MTAPIETIAEYKKARNSMLAIGAISAVAGLMVFSGFFANMAEQRFDDLKALDPHADVQRVQKALKSVFNRQVEERSPELLEFAQVALENSDTLSSEVVIDISASVTKGDLFDEIEAQYNKDLSNAESKIIDAQAMGWVLLLPLILSTTAAVLTQKAINKLQKKSSAPVPASP